MKTYQCAHHFVDKLLSDLLSSMNPVEHNLTTITKGSSIHDQCTTYSGVFALSLTIPLGHVYHNIYRNPHACLRLDGMRGIIPSLQPISM
jgi:hypothetical protein